MAYREYVFLGVTISDLQQARAICERLIDAPMKCTNSMFYGGDHCDVVKAGSRFELRLNHHDDGSGYTWCIEDAKYQLVLSCDFRSPDLRQRILGRLAHFPEIELPPEGK